jgi:hypothetical protein
MLQSPCGQRLVAIRINQYYCETMDKPMVLLAVLLAACQQHARVPIPADRAGYPQERALGSGQMSRQWELAVSAGEDDTYQIRVADAQGNVKQTLKGPSTEAALDASELLRLDDFTGDGHPDILARGHSAGASALTSETIFVYDTVTQRFVDAQDFEHEGEVSKTHQGCVSVQYRNVDNMTYAKDHYCWKDGAWVFEGSTE